MIESLKSLQSTFQNTDNPVFITNSENTILFVNHSFLRLENKEDSIVGLSSLLLKNLDSFTTSTISYDNKETIYLHIKNTHELSNTNQYDYTPLPYQNLDDKGVLIHINQEWINKFGYSRQEVIGQHFSQFITQSSKDKLHTKFVEFLNNGRIDDAEFEMIHQNQTIMPVRVYGNIEYHPSSDIKHTHCILQDTQKEKDYKQQFIQSYEETMYSFIAITEQKDGYTAGHSQRVAFYATKIAEDIGLDNENVNITYKAGMLHDIGKITVPESILLKPGSFTNLEFELMKEHPKSGYDILKPISMYDDIADIILHHHEHYDGSGYPFGKKADEIPLISQILSIADTFDAMTTNRIYKARKSVQEAIEELKDFSGIWFEPKLLKQAIKFLENLPEIKHVNQLPKNALDKQRFSYFFKDRLTDVYNGDYLNIHLQSNLLEHKYNCFNFIKIHNMSEYNSKYGWETGNVFLKNFSTKLLELIDTEHIYRVYGDDFIIIHETHIDFDIDLINNWDIIKDTCINVSVKHYDLRNFTIDSWQKLEFANK